METKMLNLSFSNYVSTKKGISILKFNLHDLEKFELSMNEETRVIQAIYDKMESLLQDIDRKNFPKVGKLFFVSHNDPTEQVVTKMKKWKGWKKWNSNVNLSFMTCPLCSSLMSMNIDVKGLDVLTEDNRCSCCKVKLYK